MKSTFRVFLILSILVSATSWLTLAEIKPKYGPKGSPRATPISLSNDFFRSAKNLAPDYWSISGFYVPQFNGASCSVASVSMVINAAKAAQAKTADDQVITQQKLLDQVTTENWKARVSAKGYKGSHGTTLDQLAAITKAAFQANGFKNVSVELVRGEKTPQAKEKLIAALEKNEASAQNFIIANFNLLTFTDDADVGHIAPIGAYDSEKKRVLIFDPDRDYYEPYWVSVDTLLEGMATLDKTAQANRGYLVIQL